MAALRIEHPYLLAQLVLNALQNGGVTAGGAMVVADEGHPAVRVGANHRNGSELALVQRQDAVVFQQHTALLRRLPGGCQVLPAFNDAVGNFIEVGVLALHNAQQIPGGEQPDGGLADVFLRHQPLVQSGDQAAIGTAAVQVTAGFQRHGGGLSRGIGYMVVFVEVPDCPAVGHHMALEPPLLPKNILQQLGASIAGSAVDGVVGTHDGLHVRFLNRRFKGRQVGVLHIPPGNIHIEAVAQRLGAGMNRKMLGAGGGFQILPLALQTTDVRLAQNRSQVGVFAVGLVAPAPAGVTENIDIGAPEGQAVVDVPVTLGGQCVILGPALGGCHIAQTADQVLVKGGGHGDGLGEAGCRTAPGNAVEGFVPPVVFGDAQPVNGRCIKPQLAGGLQNVHLGNQGFSFLLRFRSIHLSPPFFSGWGQKCGKSAV